MIAAIHSPHGRRCRLRVARPRDVGRCGDVWERETEVPLPSGFRSLGVFSTKAECLTEAGLKAMVAYSKHLRGQYREATLEATPDSGWEAKAPVEFATLSLVCDASPTPWTRRTRSRSGRSWPATRSRTTRKRRGQAADDIPRLAKPGAGGGLVT